MVDANPLELTEKDVKLMLAAKLYEGCNKVNPRMIPYVWRKKKNGVHIINVGKTWEKLLLAARIIAAVPNPEDIVVVARKELAQRAIFKFAQHVGCEYLAGKFTPGSFTNQIHAKTFKEPRLIIVADPVIDHQAVKEASYAGIPCISFCDTDAHVEHVDVAIPVNTKSPMATALSFWFLAREVLRMKAKIQRGEDWNIMVDMFLFREKEDEEKEAEEEAEEEKQEAENNNNNQQEAGGDDNNNQANENLSDNENWGEEENWGREEDEE